MIRVRPGERGRVLVLMSVTGTMMAGQAVGLAVSESLLLSRLGLQALPRAMLLASLATVVATAAYTAWLGRWSNNRLMRWLLASSILSLLAVYCLLPWAGPPLLLALYALYGVTFMVLGTHLYAVAGDFFDTLAAKRLVPLLGVGATVGELLGGLLCSAWSHSFPAESLLLVWAALQALALALLLRQPAGSPPVARRPSTVAEQMRAGARYLSRSRLGWGLTVLVTAMTLSLSVANYLISAQFVSHFPRAEELAGFLGQFLAWTNLAELVIGLTITPWFIQRLGVGGANLVHPALVLASLSVLAMAPGLRIAMVAWIARKTFQDCLASPVRSLLFNALPARFRNRSRAVIGGIVSSSAQALASVGLGLAGAGHAALLAASSVVLAGTYLGAAWHVRRAYLDTLIEGLESGRLRWLEVGSAAATWDSPRLVRLWRAWLKAPELHRAQLAALLPYLYLRGRREVLQEGLEHPDPEVRRVVVGWVVTPATLPRILLAEAAADVRLAACQALALKAPLPAEALSLAQGDPDPRVRAVATGGGNDPDRIRRQLLDHETELALLTASTLTTANLELAEPLEHLPGPVRAAVLRRRARLAAGLPLERLENEVRHAYAPVRTAALQLLGEVADPLARERIAEALPDEDPQVRAEAVRLLARAGVAGVHSAQRWLVESASFHGLRGALNVVARSGTPRAREILTRELNAQVEDARRAALDVQICRHSQAVLSLRLQFLILALEDRAERCRRLALHILALLEGEERLRGVLRTLAQPRAGQRADALEVLCNLGDRTASARLVELLEGQLPALAPQDFKPQPMLDAARQSADRWVRLGERVLSGRVRPGELRLVERLEALRSVPWLSRLDLDALQRLSGEAVEERYPSEAWLAPGKLYLVLDGELEGALPRWGEEQLFSQDPASTVRTVGVTRLLSLRAELVKATIRHQPEVGLALLRVLAARVRLAESR